MIYCRTGFPDGDQLWNMSTAKQTPNCCCQTVQPAWNYRETGMLCVAWGKQPPTHRVTHPSRVYYQLAHLPTACEKTCKLYSKILTWFRHWYYVVWVCRRVCLPGYFHTLFIGSTRPRCMCVDRPPLSTSVVLKKMKKNRLTGEFECRWFTRESTLLVWRICGVDTDHKLCMRITFYTLQLVGGV